MQHGWGLIQNVMVKCKVYDILVGLDGVVVRDRLGGQPGGGQLELFCPAGGALHPILVPLPSLNGSLTDK